ncbi:conserved hypothetical protein [Leptospira interrogans serovar Manilae]|uniref:Uncharacterized protein n=1 Tax=Leptospira interrogans serovar Manilae TaxID=214675 RepID=A0AAQ1SNC8_LEPIR|nr:conserved hypothetical protein [Leptospira interrogans serovar Manilae]
MEFVRVPTFSKWICKTQVCSSSHKFRKLEYFVYQTSVGTTADFVFFRCINYYRPYLTEFDKIHAKAIAAS